MVARVHIIAEGLVQGVGFRWFVQKKSSALGLSGWVMNRFDGSVELEAEGERSLLEALIGDLKVGPRSAHVTNLRIEWLEPTQAETSFRIR